MQLLTYLSEFMIPMLILYIVLMGLCAKRTIYKDFMKGAKDGLELTFKIMPTMIAMLVAVNVLRASGFLEFLGELLKPMADSFIFLLLFCPFLSLKYFPVQALRGFCWIF